MKSSSTPTTNGSDEDMDYKTTCQECGLLRSDCDCIDDSEEDYIHEGNFYPIPSGDSKQ